MENLELLFLLSQFPCRFSLRAFKVDKGKFEKKKNLSHNLKRQNDKMDSNHSNNSITSLNYPPSQTQTHPQVFLVLCGYRIIL